jgi:hypothetical protein
MGGRHIILPAIRLSGGWRAGLPNIAALSAESSIPNASKNWTDEPRDGMKRPCGYVDVAAELFCFLVGPVPWLAGGRPFCCPAPVLSGSYGRWCCLLALHCSLLQPPTDPLVIGTHPLLCPVSVGR